MAEKKLTDGSLALEEKQYRVITIEATEKPQDIKLRVAAYARVSSASDDQLNSFAAQNKYYTTLISSKENWAMVDIYADEGITGTSIEKRDDFKRLLADCKRGKIDRVLVKSISRFARNTKECLESIRELKGLGVSIYFEKENIDTATMSGEMMTALFASFAQAESESISGNMRWSIQKRMQDGTFVPSTMAFGYTREDGGITINVDQAIFVYQMFYRYLSGENTSEIAEWLNEQKVTYPILDERVWSGKAVARILKNEKYIGDSLWQKSYRTDTLPRRELPNRGEREQYYAENTHPAIIEKWAYQKVQQLMKARAVQCQKLGTDSPFQSKVVCGNCGGYLRSKTINGRRYRSCRGHEASRNNCPITQIAEAQIEEAFCRLYYTLKENSEVILGRMLTSLQTIRSRRMLWSLDVIELNKRISELTSQNQLLTTLKQQGLVDSDIFISQTNMLTEQLRAAKLEKERLLDTEHDEAITSTKELLEILEDGPDLLTDFDAELFGELIDKIIVDSNESIRFCLKNGLELTEAIERTVR